MNSFSDLFAGPVLAIAILGNEIVAAGAFDSAGTIAANNIARWSNGAWKRLGAGEANGIGTPFFDEVRALATSGQNRYVGGYFFQAGGKDANSIARWNSASDAWNTLGDDPITNGVQGSVNSLLVSGEQLYVAGSIGAAGEVLVNNLAAWNITTSAWDSLGAGTDGEGRFRFDNLPVGRPLRLQVEYWLRGNLFSTVQKVGSNVAALYP